MTQDFHVSSNFEKCIINMMMVRHHNLKSLNTLGIDVHAKYYFESDSVQKIQEVVKKLNNEKKFVLGGGANIMFTKNFDGLVIKYTASNIEILDESNDEVMIKADAGVIWEDLVSFAVEKGLGGIENLTEIPGTVGGACVQNIGAYGQCLEDVFLSCEALSLEGEEVIDFGLDDMGFGYRQSRFKNDKHPYLITSAIFSLKKEPKPNLTYWSKKHGSVLGDLKDSEITIKKVREVISNMRRGKFPDMSIYGCAGSFFKNPVIDKDTLKKVKKDVPNIQIYPAHGIKYSADQDERNYEYVKIPLGQVLDDGLGLRGHWKENVGLHDRQAMILVTNKKAKPKEVKDFVDEIVQKVFDKYGIVVEREVEYVD